MATNSNRSIGWVEQGYVPDAVIRAGIRRLLKERLGEIAQDDVQRAGGLASAFAAELADAQVALVPEAANAQHYEVPQEFFGLVLGAQRKYSSCLYLSPQASLDEAESEALAATCTHAGLRDGQRVLELGCGWGSLTLWMAAHYPNSSITAVSNSNSQRAYIESAARARGLNNLKVITCDMNVFDPARFDASAGFDRIVSVEMFEHMRNWPELFKRVAGWLVPGGRFFMHVFVHGLTPYPFVERDASDWMSRHFFTGGMMPSDDLALQFQDHLRFVQRWRWDGSHYQRTANHWLANMDAQRAQVMPVLQQAYGSADASVWWMRWRIFFMSCAELFGYENGQRWWVSHYLFERR